MLDAELIAAVQAFRSARVTCVGDIMLDRYLHGVVERISPEAPVPVLRVTSESDRLGGVGNVVGNLCSLGVPCRLVSVVGDDAAGHRLGELAAKLPDCDSQLVASGQVSTTEKIRMVSGRQQMLRVDRETPQEIPAEVAVGIGELVSHDCTPKVLVLSDYNKGVLTSPDAVKKLIHRACAKGQTAIVDPKGADFSRYAGASIITPNRAELERATMQRVETHSEAISAARDLAFKHWFGCVIVTLSEEGMIVVPRTGEAKHLQAEASEVVDVSGAGDTVVATLAAALASYAPLMIAARLANIAAGIVVGKPGTACVSTGELLARLSEREACVSLAG